MWAGDVADGERALAPIRALGPDADFFGPTEYADFQCSVDDPPGYRNYWTAENVVDLPDAAIDALVRCATDLPAGPSQLFIVAWGGAVRRFGADSSPLAGREARFIVHPLLLWGDPADDERNRRLARAFRDDMRRWSTGATYPNFLGDEGAARMSAAFGASAQRLAAIKARWDPHGLFRTHQTIRTPTRPMSARHRRLPARAAAPTPRRALPRERSRTDELAAANDLFCLYLLPDPSQGASMPRILLTAAVAVAAAVAVPSVAHGATLHQEGRTPHRLLLQAEPGETNLVSVEGSRAVVIPTTAAHRSRWPACRRACRSTPTP